METLLRHHTDKAEHFKEDGYSDVPFGDVSEDRPLGLPTDFWKEVTKSRSLDCGRLFFLWAKHGASDVGVRLAVQLHDVVEIRRIAVDEVRRFHKFILLGKRHDVKLLVAFVVRESGDDMDERAVLYMEASSLYAVLTVEIAHADVEVHTFEVTVDALAVH